MLEPFSVTKYCSSGIILFFLFFPIQLVHTQYSSQFYALDWETDGIVMATGLLTAYTGTIVNNQVTPITEPEMRMLNKNSINFIDRVNAGSYSRRDSHISDVLAAGSTMLTLLFAADEVIIQDAAVITVMYVQTMMFAKYLPYFAKGGTRRIRPFVYGTDAPLVDRLNADARRSFFSSHAAWSFAASTFFVQVFSSYHPDAPLLPYVWGGAYGLATAVSFLRITSGEHFITDVIAGAAAGSVIGYVIPLLHRKRSSELTFTPYSTPSSAGLTMTLYLK